MMAARSTILMSLPARDGDRLIVQACKQLPQAPGKPRSHWPSRNPRDIQSHSSALERVDRPRMFVPKVIDNVACVHYLTTTLIASSVK
jgi:hypothetical protein